MVDKRSKMDDSNDVIILLSSSEDNSSSEELAKYVKQTKSSKISTKIKPKNYVLSPTTKVESKLARNNFQNQRNRKLVALEREESLSSEDDNESDEIVSDYDLIKNTRSMKPKATTNRTKKLVDSKGMVRSKAIKVESSSNSDSESDLQSSSSSNGETKSESEDESLIQVPDSSPQRKQTLKISSGLDSSPPAKITTKLPNLEKFAWKEENTFSRANYAELKKMFPKLAPNVIISTLKKEKTMRNAIRFLKTLPDSGHPKSSRTSRLDSLHNVDGILIPSSPISSPPPSSRRLRFNDLAVSRLERKQIERNKEKLDREKRLQREREAARRKAEEEKIVSSKVQLGTSKPSLRERYINDRLAKRKTHDDDKQEEQAEEDESSDEDSIIELVDDSDDQIITHQKSKTTKKRYEDDDDYNDNYVTPSRKKANDATRINRAVKRAAVADDDDFMLPEFEADEDADLNINEKIIKLFNNADIRDLLDLSNMKPEQAKLVIEHRPYHSIKDIKKVDLNPTKSSGKLVRNPTEKYLETIAEKLAAYTAIDTLLKQCFDYSKSITSEIKKWGVNLKGKNLDGELSLTEVNINLSDESGSDDETGDESEEEPLVRKKFKKIRVDGSENDDDFMMGRNRKLYKSNIDNSKVNSKPGYFKKKPALLSEEISLKDYQQVGINWIYTLFRKQLSCILADEMGLGKTAQVIAFLSHLKKKRYKGPHLIVVPSSTLENWLREFEKFSPSLKVVPYYGSLDEREELRSMLYEDSDYDVVVTTYNLTTGKLDAPFLQSLDFNVIVYDEGHMLKNAASDRYKKLTRLKANFRMLLTGTPLQNNLKELISLLDFILPEVFDSKMKKLQLLFDQKTSTKTEEEKIEGETYNPLMSEQAISKAKVMMSPFVLRRTKAQVMKDLPTKHTIIEYCELNTAQRRIYEEELKFVENLKTEKARRKTLPEKEQKQLPPLEKRSTNILMTLRKACMHPLLFRRLYTDKMLKVMSKLIMKNDDYKDANEKYIFEDMQIMSDYELSQLCHNFPNELGKFVLKQSIYEDSGKTQKLVEILTEKIKKGEKILIFSLFTQMLDILERVLSIHNWKFLRLDGSTQVDTRQNIIDKFYEDQTISVMLLSTKAGGFGINLVCATNVIIYDQSLNPHDDRQAEDRAHRVGQTKDVHVIRLITKNSIEENILHMAFNKLQLDNSMMAQNVEDVLLKTVEDLIAAKNAEPKKIEELPNELKKEESVFEAFESPVLEMDIEEDQDEPIEIDHSTMEENTETNKRTRRRKQNISYVDDAKIPKEWLYDDQDGEDNNRKKKRAKKEVKSEEIHDQSSQEKDNTYVPGADSENENFEEKKNENDKDKVDVQTSTLDPVSRTQIAIGSIESNRPFVEVLMTENGKIENVKSVDEYLREINNLPEGIEDDPVKREQYHNQAAERILLLQKQMKLKILTKMAQNVQHSKNADGGEYEGNGQNLQNDRDVQDIQNKPVQNEQVENNEVTKNLVTVTNENSSAGSKTDLIKKDIPHDSAESEAEIKSRMEKIQPNSDSAVLSSDKSTQVAKPQMMSISDILNATF